MRWESAWETQVVAAQRQADVAEERAASVRTAVAAAQAAHVFLTQWAAEVREQAREALERLGTRALAAVFGPRWSLALHVDVSHQRPEVQIAVITETPAGRVAADPLEAHGGGVVDVVATALRLGMIFLHAPPLPGPIFLDEPGKHLSAEYQPAFGRLLADLARETGVPVVCVTHEAVLMQYAQARWVVEAGEDGAPSTVQPASPLGWAEQESAERG